MMTNTGTAMTYHTHYGEHCRCCGSLAEACGDVRKCHLDAQLHVDAAIRSGNTQSHPMLETAHRMLGETVLETIKNR